MSYLVIFYPVSAGQNGPLLGSDEEEIVLLLFIIIDAKSNQIVAEKRYTVKPRTADINENVLSEQCRNEFGLSEDQVKRGELLETVIEMFDEWIRRFLAAPSGRSSKALSAAEPDDAGDLASPTSSSPTFSSPTSTSSNPYGYSREPEAWIGPTITLVCDGQLPLRQCFHPEACNKNIEVPHYYYSFFDLRKEFKKAHNSEEITCVRDMLTALGKEPLIIPGDQAMAEAESMTMVVRDMLDKGYPFAEPETITARLEPGICSKNEVIDNNCVVRARGLPWQSSDQDIARFFRGLNVAKGGVALCLSQQGRRNGEALCRFQSQEHRDMALKRHKHHMGSRYIEVYRASGDDFINVAGGNNNEAQAFLSRNGQVIVRMRGLPYDCTAKQVVEFFAGTALRSKVKEEAGSASSEAGDDLDSGTGENGGSCSDSGRGDSQDEDQEVTDPNACHVMDGEAGVLFVKKTDGRATGDAFVMFATEDDGVKALLKHRQSIGARYIELFRSTTAEVQQILNRPVESRPTDTQAQAQQVAAAVAAAAQPALSVQPVGQLPLLPQQIITSGIRKDCIRLRGLPYEAQVEHILEFLGDHAKRIAYRGVHMIYNAQQQPSGEAFIQMNSEQSACIAASEKHHKNMSFGKKQRYIEVFQCSGQDMQLVLSGGVPPSAAGPAAGTGPALLSPGTLPTVSRPVSVSGTGPVSVTTSLSSSALMSTHSSMMRGGMHMPGSALDQLVRSGIAGYATSSSPSSAGISSPTNSGIQVSQASDVPTSAGALMFPFGLTPTTSILSRTTPGGFNTVVSPGTASPFTSLLRSPPPMLISAASQASAKRSFEQAFLVSGPDQAGSLAKRHQPWSIAQPSLPTWPGQPTNAAAAAAAVAQAQAAAAGLGLSLGVHGLPSHVLAYPSHSTGLY